VTWNSPPTAGVGDRMTISESESPPLSPPPLDTSSLADRCKDLESREADRRAMRGLPLLARLDGRAFHTFTRGLTRPFDPGLTALMIDVAGYLIEKTHALVGYTQSDEITLAWHYPADAGNGSAFLFDGRFQKLASVLAGMASARFCLRLPVHMPSETQRLDRAPHFDGRIWQVPSLEEAADVFRWREDDAVRNSVTSAALAHFSDLQIFGKSSAQKREMLAKIGVTWDDYPRSFQRGTYVQRRKIEAPIDEDLRMRVPIAHRPVEGARLTRSHVVDIDLPPARQVKNLVDVLFHGAAPVLVAPAEVDEIAEDCRGAGG
jgi:tRNA(His) guanylyltransferase